MNNLKELRDAVEYLSPLRMETHQGDSDCDKQGRAVIKLRDFAAPFLLDDPITPEVCERLGFTSNRLGKWTKGQFEVYPVSYGLNPNYTTSVYWCEKEIKIVTTAAQLAHLIAAMTAGEGQS